MSVCQREQELLRRNKRETEHSSHGNYLDGVRGLSAADMLTDEIHSITIEEGQETFSDKMGTLSLSFLRTFFGLIHRF